MISDFRLGAVSGGPGLKSDLKSGNLGFIGKGKVNKNNKDTQNYYYLFIAGSLLGCKILQKNDSHITVTTGAQYMGFMSSPSTKYHIQIRHPTDR